MNILDYGVILLLGFFLLAGWYYGFVNTLFSLGAYVISCGLSFLFRLLLAGLIKGNVGLYSMVLYYTEGAEWVKDVALARSNIENISSEQLAGVMKSANLPIPLEMRITQNIAKEAFAKDGIFSLGDYFNQTIVNVVINIACILILFVVIRMLFAFVIHMYDYAKKGYPMLQTADSLLGASFGLIRGFLAMLMIFMVTPAVLIVLPKLGEFVNNSFFGNFFYKFNFLLRMVSGT